MISDDDYEETHSSYNSYEIPKSKRDFLFSDPFQEIEQLKRKNKLLFDQISAISEPPREIPVLQPVKFEKDQAKSYAGDEYQFEMPKRQNPKTTKYSTQKDIQDHDFNDNFRGGRERRIKKSQKNINSINFSDPSNKSSKLFSGSSNKSSNKPSKFSTEREIKSIPTYKERWNRTFSPKPRRSPLIKRAKEMQVKLEKMKQENVKLRKDYRSMLYKVSKTREDVEILQNALEDSRIDRLLTTPKYDWSVYSEYAF
ncbi:hypothetical protein TRFO_18849 [Tritrichomonas foetus]|uniref:Uncharacterized protein n=1 Tax=Tritrichomonas foetus TaxID=1144522 RepID=A0A1J4KJW4_9EUKA|nr:hypothetical protein TRFO_18849 [Tritrichomonas foetus]|eukprot:OHT11599.1 hypothetical protein TRFO_18849 [Tritrichomonas foetus]